ncbi:MAG: DUF4062 domain-containing protein [Ruminococcus sp.]|nr:DUF4062 domain-containing protein [Ruminococcus sp.]
MNSNQFYNALPPVIRVFISSTFSDMEQERNYFNEHIAPKIKHICEERGVSFFSVDLRWGITEEDQVNGQVLPICLSEIDRCRPFFIGILGNRYGSVLESIPEQIGNSLPWLTGKEGKSITELEMLYAVLDTETDNPCKNCSFYLRSDELSAKLYGNTAQDSRLTDLKNTIINNSGVPYSRYNDLKEFGKAVYSDILAWLDAEFPAPAQVAKSRRLWYNSELLRNYTPDPTFHSFLGNYFNESSRALLIYGDGARGKTTFLTGYTPDNGHKILINCGSDDLFLYWPSIAKEIVNQLNIIDNSLGIPQYDVGVSVLSKLTELINNESTTVQDSELSSDFYLVTDEERENFRLSFLQWISAINPKEHIFIFINDLNLLEDEESRLLSWLPVHTKNLHFVCTTNDNDMVENAEALGWNCKEMPLFPKELAQEFLLKHLNIYGKKLSSAQNELLLHSELTSYPGNLKSVANFLIQCGRFHNLDKLIGDIADHKSPTEFFRYIYNYCIADLSQQEIIAFRAVLGMVSYSSLSLNEQECYNLAEQTAHIGAIEWAHLHNAFEQFGIIKGDYWITRDEEIQKFTCELLTREETCYIRNYLGEYLMSKLHTPADESKTHLQVIREKTTFAKSALRQFCQAKSWSRLTEVLLDYELLIHMSRLNWKAVLVSWVHIFLNSDTDIPKTILSFLKSIDLSNPDNKVIALKVASILSDMNFHSHSLQAKRLLGVSHIPSALHSELKGVTPEFATQYNNLWDLKEKAEYRQLHKITNELLHHSQELPPEAMCKLLFFKADCESHLSLHNECLETSHLYYQAALSCASTFDLLRALSIRGTVLYRLNKYSEAASVQQNVSKLALQEGNLRTYLSALNILATCEYRNNRFEESLRLLDKIYSYWARLNDKLEISNTHLNKCNALYLSGDTNAALSEARLLYNSIPDDASPLMRNLRISVLVNIGIYMHTLGDNAAEATLLEALSEAEALGSEATAISAMEALIKLYKGSDRAIEMSEIGDKLMELLWSRQAYRQIPGILKEVADFLLVYRYNSLADKLQSKWRGRFASISGGSDFLAQALKDSSSDSKKLDELKEKLAMARSDNNLSEAADLLHQMALVTDKSDDDECIGYLSEAAELYKKISNTSEHDLCLCEAITKLIKKAEIRNKPLFEKLRAKITSSDIRQVIHLWTSFGSSGKTSINAIFEKFRINDDPSVKKDSEQDKLRKIASYGKACDYIVVRCLIDLAFIIRELCSGEEIVELATMLPKDAGDYFAYVLVEIMTMSATEDIEYLKTDYVSPKAEKLLSYYEKCIYICAELKTGDVAALAGNLALMFRRRKDKEKTLKYHTISGEMYRQQGKIKDALIETMNLATAYNEFDSPEQAIKLLYQGLEEAESAGETMMQGVLAGNISAFLVRKKDRAYNEEIIRCFEIEESSLRKCNALREVVISLINQAIFYMENSDLYGDTWIQKANDAEQYINKYDLRDFKSTLKRIRLAGNYKGKEADSPKADLTQMEEKANSLLALRDIYHAKEITPMESGTCRVKCVPTDKLKSVPSILEFTFTASEPYFFRVLCACRSERIRNDAPDYISKYVTWWNAKNLYKISVQEDKVTIQCQYDFQADDWESACRLFSRFTELWQADMACYGLICLGYNDLDIVCKKKEDMLEPSDF